MSLIDETTHDEVGKRMSTTVETIEGLRLGLLRLRSITTPAKLLQQGAIELVDSCGFSRVVISRVAGSQLIPIAWHADPDNKDFNQRLNSWREEPPVVTHAFHEGEILRRRQAVLARDALTHPLTYKPIMIALDCRAYVAAPITVAGRAVATIHADRPAGDVDVGDRAVLATYAECLAMALERSELAERIRVHEAKMRELLSTGIGLFDELVEDTVDFTRPSSPAEPASSAQQEPRRLDRAAQAGALSLLTRREIEVLDMIALGATNMAIGEALFITEVTVKSHVQHILRKLRASNRAEAVARYLRVSA
ncbi:MAG TPA: LuxR C-terminal-related transcriptional regulator [Mycobacterium sp.]|jgi:DNA-binding CsgD family transcriptional regulator|nr:LuxR C-terminal-related transcriptional regulator [Mycobacterium sp.]